MRRRGLATQVVRYPEFRFTFNVAVIGDMAHGTLGRLDARYVASPKKRLCSLAARVIGF